jgi:hypothetical protein
VINPGKTKPEEKKNVDPKKEQPADKEEAVDGEKGKRGPKINENVQVKICDMGNGCWTYHHFTPEI